MALLLISISPLGWNFIFNTNSRTGQVTKKPPLEVTNAGSINFRDNRPEFVRVEDSKLHKDEPLVTQGLANTFGMIF